MHDREDLEGAGRLIAHFMNRLPAGWEFLLRANKDGRGAYMCNFMSPDRVPVMVLNSENVLHNAGPGIYSPAYGPTAVDAVTNAAQGVPEHLWIEED